MQQHHPGDCQWRAVDRSDPDSLSSAIPAYTVNCLHFCATGRDKMDKMGMRFPGCEAKDTFVDWAVEGKPFGIAKAGRPTVKVTRIETRPVRHIGFLEGAHKIPEDFGDIGGRGDCGDVCGAMSVFPDTHLLLWAAHQSTRLPSRARGR